MKLKSLQMSWTITLPFEETYDMLGGFNEIIFIMLWVASMRLQITYLTRFIVTNIKKIPIKFI